MTARAQAVDDLYHGDNMPTVAQVEAVIAAHDRQAVLIDGLQYALTALRKPALCGNRSNAIRHIKNLLGEPV